MLTTILAADGAGNPMEFNPIAYITSLVVFLVAFGVLAAMVWPKITKALDERQNKILGEIDAAEKARGDAEAARAKFEKDLAAARDESAKMIAQSRADAQRLADEIRAKSETELQDRLTKANAEIEGAKRAAVAEIHAKAADLATSIAGKILQRQITETDQKRLVEESLAELAGRRN
ncbi:MAG: F0F1 ATP synthase subunit B [Phycisphaerae bacterium]|nr:F0F1 ATP synthase subunit B [Phycisphaerae bacterium]